MNNIINAIKQLAPDTKLYSPMFENIYFQRVEYNDLIQQKPIIFCTLQPKSHNKNAPELSFDEFGRCNTGWGGFTLECMIFPAKRKSWFEIPIFKEGDVVESGCYKYTIKQVCSDHYKTSGIDIYFASQHDWKKVENTTLTIKIPIKVRDILYYVDGSKIQSTKVQTIYYEYRSYLDCATTVKENIKENIRFEFEIMGKDCRYPMDRINTQFFLNKEDLVKHIQKQL